MGSADLSDVENDSQLEELRKIRFLLERIASYREYEKKVIIVGDMLNSHYARDIEDALRHYPEWEVESTCYYENGRTKGEMPNGRGLIILLRRAKMVMYPTNVMLSDPPRKEVQMAGASMSCAADIPPPPSVSLNEASTGEGPKSLVDEDDFSQPSLKIDEACVRFAVGRAAVMKAINDGSLPSVKIAPESPNALGHKYTYRLRLPDVERWHREIYSKLPPPKRGRPVKR